MPPVPSTSGDNAPSPKPILIRKASSELASSTIRGIASKRQRTKSISSNASSSSTNNYQGTSASATSSTSLASALSNLTAATSTTAVPAYYRASSRSPAAMIIPSPTMSMSMHATPSPASTSSYIPPSPPVSLGLSPYESSSYPSTHRDQHKHTSGGCGVCDSSSGVSCICQDVGLKPHNHRHQQEEDELDEVDFQDLNLIPSSSGLPSELDRCGFCTESTTGACICAEVGLRKMSSHSITHRPLPSSLKNTSNTAVLMERRENEDKLAPLPPSRLVARPLLSPSSSSTSTSNIPPGSTSVRLRLPKRGIAAGQLWRIDTTTLPAPQQQQSLPLKQQEQPSQLSAGQRHPAAAAGVALRRKLIKVGSRLPCSGDPKTCLACADDP